MRITMIDRDSQFHSGVPYGHRSGPSSLLITRLADFLSKNELAHFTRWLDENREAILATSKLDKEWLHRHSDDIRNGFWDNLYLPRRLYGRYLRNRAESEIHKARRDGTAIVDYLTAEITDITTEPDGTSVLHGIQSQHAATTDSLIELRTTTTILSIGSPPVKQLNVSAESGTLQSESAAQHELPGYIADIHVPTIEDSLASIRKLLLAAEPRDRRILVIGGNADALEFILASDALRHETHSALTVLSTRGRPYYWRQEKPGEQPEIPAVQMLLDRIDEGRSPSAEEFYSAVETDVTESIVHGRDKATVSAIMDAVGRVIGTMDDTQRGEMAGTYGIPISNLLRQAGGDAVDLLDSTSGDCSLTFERGRFDSAVLRNGLFSVSLKRPASCGKATPAELTDRYAVIINATGFESVAEARITLLRNLLASGTATASSSGAGLAADSHFRIAPGIFVLGPLLSGFNHDGTVVWHAESVNRIVHLAAQLAPVLISDAVARRAAQPKDRSESTIV